MNQADHDLNELLRQADTALQSPPQTLHVALLARRRLQRQARLRARAIACAAALAIAPLLLLRTPPRLPHESAPQAVDAAPLTRAEQLKRGAAALVRLNESLARWESRDTATYKPRVRSLPASLEARIQAETTALLLVEQGRRLDARGGLSGAARTEYQRAVALFPHSEGAELARRRLSESSSQPGGA